MDEIRQGLAQAARLLAGDPATWKIVGLTLAVSGTAMAFSTLLGVPLGALLGLRRFWGRRLAVALIYTGMGLPPVVVGLAVYLIFSRAGPLGALGWLFTPPAMVVAQVIISLPVVAGFTMVAVESLDPAIGLQARALGATGGQVARTLLWEARGGVVAALLGGFGAIISEVGAVMLVGGNIAGSTRVLTTAIVLETRQGEFGLAMALSFVLVGLTFLVNAIVLRLQRRSA